MKEWALQGEITVNVTFFRVQKRMMTVMMMIMMIAESRVQAASSCLLSNSVMSLPLSKELAVKIYISYVVSLAFIEWRSRGSPGSFC